MKQTRMRNYHNCLYINKFIFGRIFPLKFSTKFHKTLKHEKYMRQSRFCAANGVVVNFDFTERRIGKC